MPKMKTKSAAAKRFKVTGTGKLMKMKAYKSHILTKKTTKRKRKGDFRKLWIVRINAAARLNGLSYSKFMHGLKLANIDINRKMLAELAVNDAAGFTALADAAKAKIA